MRPEPKQDVKQLACSLASYADLLRAKRARMEDIHSSTEVVRQISKNLTVHFTERPVLLPPFLASISESPQRSWPQCPFGIGKVSSK